MKLDHRCHSILINGLMSTQTIKDIILLCTVIIASIAFLGAYQARNDANKAQRHLCAWRFFEDGSAIIRTNDTTRFRCMEASSK